METPSIRVLLIDDDEDDYVITRDLLSGIEGGRIELEWVSRYDAALELIGRNEHDLYLLDYQLGERDGLDLMREALERGCKAPMIVLTGQDDHGVDMQAMLAGAGDYLTKGRIDAALLKRSIRYAIERAQTLQALRESRSQLAGLYKREQDRSRRLETLNKIFTATAVLDQDQLLAQVCQLISDEFGYYRVHLGLVSEREIRFQPQHARWREQAPDPARPADVIARHLPSLVTQAVNQRRSLYAPDVHRHPGIVAEAGSLTQSELAIPIVANQNVIAVLDVHSEQVNGFNQSDMLVLNLVAAQLARALENARLYQEINRLFTSYVPAAVVHHMLANPSKSSLGGERQLVTVLFADLRGFSTYAEASVPEHVIEDLNTYIALAADAIIHHGGTLDKFMGDAVMGLFNAPEAQADHAWRAVKASLLIQEKTELFNLASRRPRLQFGIGLNTGEAVVGNIGTATLLNYTAIGDAINIAERLQEQAHGGQVLASTSTYEIVRHLVEAEPLGAIAVKGRSQAVEAYQITGIRRPSQP